MAFGACLLSIASMLQVCEMVTKKGALFVKERTESLVFIFKLIQLVSDWLLRRFGF